MSMKNYENHGWQVHVAWFIIRRIPYVLIKEPERFLVGFFGVVTGIIMLYPPFHPPSIETALHPPQVWLWALSFLFGGIGKIYALIILTRLVPQQTRKIQFARLAERTGASLLAVACFVYAMVVLEINGMAGFMTTVMFVGIGLTNTIRLVVSVANGYLTRLAQGALR